jgi:hemolysin activation/secretion protein
VEIATEDGNKPLITETASTKTGPKFEVQRYQVAGNTLLPPTVIGAALTNATGAFGTNVTFTGVQAAMSELVQAYRARGYVTVSVGLPKQKLTNATVKLQVTEGKLAQIRVTGNRYFSSNNVARALPSLHTNTFLNGLIFQAELNRANGNQDRQIYPVVSPGAEPGTTDLKLQVKDRLPVHGKVELNNENSPGTPDLRLNSSVVYNNLWQHEHSLGLQYNFSPEEYKGGDWNWYDKPLVATYSAFYRLPLGNPSAIEKDVESAPGTFGYNEATRQFNLPPPSGQPELNFYASRAVIDTGVQNTFSTNLVNVPGVRQLVEQDFQQDLTINEDLGFRYSQPFVASSTLMSSFSGGLDFKRYVTADHRTNSFNDIEITYDENGNPITHSASDAITTDSRRNLEYLPLALNYSMVWRTPRLTLMPGVGLSANVWYSGSRSNLEALVGTTNSGTIGPWVTLTPSLAADFIVYTNWVLSARANGQWANEPLISNEEFGAGGVNSVRGYHEGEVFGDTGWHLSLEQQTPPVIVGVIGKGIPLTVRGSIYTDFAQTYLLDPQGRPGTDTLWGTGVGGVMSLGTFWDARLLFAVPLRSAGTTRAYQPRFNFSLTGQF